MTNIQFTDEATNNLISQALYIYELTLDTQKADKYLLTMKAHIVQSLGYFPRLGRPAEAFGKGVRKLVHQQYTILYKLQINNEISILTIYRENLPNI